MSVAEPRMERLLGLITLLLNSKDPVSFQQLREEMPEYGVGKESSALRRFERDRATLTDELGVSIEYVEKSSDGGDPPGSGYVIRREDYYLPDLQLSRDELVALYLAAAAARGMDGFPFTAEVTRVLEKLRFASEGAEADTSGVLRYLTVRPPSGPCEAVGQSFTTLRDAILRRKLVTVRYRGSKREDETCREVEPYGLFLREGRWCLYAHCRLRGERRTFSLDSILALEVNPRSPKSPDFEQPEDVEADLRYLVKERPWRYPVSESIQARVLLEPRLAFASRSLFGDDAVVRERSDGKADVTVTVSHPEAFLEQVLGLCDGVELLEPRELREALVSRLDHLIDEIDHEEPGTGL